MGTNNYEKIATRNPAAREILDRKPVWIIRWGISLLFVLFTLLIAFTSFINYSPVIKSNILLTTHNSFVRVLAPESGRISQFFVAEGGFVRKDDKLIVVESDLDSENSRVAKKYMVTAPDSGIVYFIRPLVKEEFVLRRMELFAIIPKAEPLIGLVTMRYSVARKVRTGDQARIVPSNCKKPEFGHLVGIVKSISSPVDGDCSIEIELQNGLVTTLNRRIAYSPKILGTVEIVTGDIRLSEAIIDQMLSLFNPR